jgi:hypothetical protein
MAASSNGQLAAGTVLVKAHQQDDSVLLSVLVYLYPRMHVSQMLAVWIVGRLVATTLTGMRTHTYMIQDEMITMILYED